MTCAVLRSYTGNHYHHNCNPHCARCLPQRWLQLHGGAGYMLEYPVSRNLVDARVPRIYGGSNEIMRELIGRTCKIDA